MTRAAQFLRGPAVSAQLSRLGVHPRRFWLLMDLFDQLSERGEMLDQFGRDGVALRAAGWMYAAMTGVLSLLLLAARPPLPVYFSLFLGLTAFLLLTVLLSEAGNSLVNPSEGLALAHQPIDGATYTAAKLMHLGRIVLYLTPATNALPALLGLRLNGAKWYYPGLHCLSALGVAVAAALLCCALYGWLIRFVPAPRLRAAGQFAAALPLLAMPWMGSVGRRLAGLNLGLAMHPAAWWAALTAAVAAVLAIVLTGLRALSADYLIRVSAIVHGHGTKRARVRSSWFGAIVGRVFGGPPARAGFAYVLKLARRDFQFRRQMLSMSIGVVGLLAPAASHWRGDPFATGFTIAHLLPHAVGLLLFFACSFLPFGNDFKGAWMFLLVPAHAFRGFSRGIYAALCIPVIVLPHVLLLLPFAFLWGPWHALLFTAYSVSVCSVYLGMELSLIDSVPFSRQVDPKRAAAMLPMILFGGACIAGTVAVQYLVLFRTPVAVAAVTLGAAGTAVWLTRRALAALESSMRYSLSLLSGESGSLYKEIDL